MIYYTALDTLKGITLSFSVGVLLNAFAISLDVVFDFLKAFLHIPIEIVGYLKGKEKAVECLKRKRALKPSCSGAVLIVKDLLFSCLSGFLISLLLYVAADGEIRVYIPVIAIMSYFLSKKALGDFMYKTIRRGIELLFSFIRSILIFSVTPFRFALRRLVLVVVRISNSMKIKKQGKCKEL